MTVYRITQALSLGKFATAERAELLLAHGVTHVLNVSESPSVVGAAFREVAWVPIRDYHHIPADIVIQAMDALHQMVSEPGAHVYVHCMAGQQRGPTVLWLYLIACGHSAEQAREVIESRSPDANAGFAWLVDHRSVLLAQKHGLRNYLPLKRAEVIVPYSSGI